MWVFLFPIKKALFIIHNTLMHHRGVGGKFINIVHAAALSNPLNVKLIMMFIMSVIYHRFAGVSLTQRGIN